MIIKIIAIKTMTITAMTIKRIVLIYELFLMPTQHLYDKCNFSVCLNKMMLIRDLSFLFTHLICI